MSQNKIGEHNVKKVFEWLDLLRKCEIKTVLAILGIICTIIGSAYMAQANVTKWIINANNAMVEGKIAIEQGKMREKEVESLKSRVCVMESKIDIVLDNQKEMGLDIKKLLSRSRW
jgi:hypothetical protein